MHSAALHQHCVWCCAHGKVHRVSQRMQGIFVDHTVVRLHCALPLTVRTHTTRKQHCCCCCTPMSPLAAVQGTQALRSEQHACLKFS